MASPSPPASSSPWPFLATYTPQALMEGLLYARQGSVWTQLHSWSLSRTLRSGHPSYLICQIGVSGNRANPNSGRSQSQEQDSCLSPTGHAQFDLVHRPVTPPGGPCPAREPTGGVPISLPQHSLSWPCRQRVPCTRPPGSTRRKKWVEEKRRRQRTSPSRCGYPPGAPGARASSSQARPSQRRRRIPTCARQRAVAQLHGRGRG